MTTSMTVAWEECTAADTNQPDLAVIMHCAGTLINRHTILYISNQAGYIYREEHHGLAPEKIIIWYRTPTRS